MLYFYVVWKTSKKFSILLKYIVIQVFMHAVSNRPLLKSCSEVINQFNYFLSNTTDENSLMSCIIRISRYNLYREWFKRIVLPIWFDFLFVEIPLLFIDIFNPILMWKLIHIALHGLSMKVAFEHLYTDDKRLIKFVVWYFSQKVWEN